MRPSRASSLPPFVDEELVAFLLFFSQLHVYMDVSLYACLTGRTLYGTADGTRQFTVSWRGKQCLHCDFFFILQQSWFCSMDVVCVHRGECKSDRVWSTQPAVACRLIFSMRLRVRIALPLSRGSGARMLRCRT